jgi:hypothetical protein
MLGMKSKIKAKHYSLQKEVKYLRINLSQDVKVLYNENHRTLKMYWRHCRMQSPLMFNGLPEIML